MQRLTQESYFVFSLGTQKNQKIEKKKRKRKKKTKKNQKKRKIEKKKKKEEKKIDKSKKIDKKIKKEKSLFAVVLDKMCVFCLYPILDSQQCVKRGSCRRPILSGPFVSF